MADRCPTCGCQLIRPYGLKRECKRCFMRRMAHPPKENPIKKMFSVHDIFGRLNARKIVRLTAMFLMWSLLIGVLSWAVFQPAILHSYGIIRTIGVEVYKDADLTTTLTEIDWTFVDPGQTKTYPAWIKNVGNDKITLNMWTSDWQPTNASDWITLTWNYTESVIPAKASIPVLFTLSVHWNVTGIEHFSFDIWIEGVTYVSI